VCILYYPQITKTNNGRSTHKPEDSHYCTKCQADTEGNVVTHALKNVPLRH